MKGGEFLDQLCDFSF